MEQNKTTSRRHLKVLIFSTFIAGLCSIVYELLIATTGSYFLGDSIRQFSLVIGFYMAFMGVGSYLSKLIPDNKVLTLFVTFEIILGLVGGLSVPLLYFSFAYLDYFQFSILLATSAVGVLIGLEIPLLSRLMSHHFELKDNISNILSLDYFGALIATLVFPFLLLPMMGVFKTSLFFGLINMSIGFSVVYYFSDSLSLTKKKSLYLFSIISLLFLVLALIFSKWLLRTWTNELYDDRVIYTQETPYQQVVMTKSNDDVRLFLNGNLQFSSMDEYRYHEALIHIPLINHTAKDVLLLGGGDGLAIRELLKYSTINTITLVDLDPAVTNLAKSNYHLTELNKHSLDHEKVSVIHQDAFGFLRNSGKKYDFIVIDLPDPNNTSLARLYSREFYWSIKSSLNEDGRFVTQATSPFYAKEAFWTISNTIENAGFASVIPYHVSIPSFGEWGFILATRTTTPKNSFTEHDFSSMLETQYIDASSIIRAMHFEKDLLTQNKDISTLDSPKVLQHYLSAWKRWY